MIKLDVLVKLSNFDNNIDPFSVKPSKRITDLLVSLPRVLVPDALGSRLKSTQLYIDMANSKHFSFLAGVERKDANTQPRVTVDFLDANRQPCGRHASWTPRWV